VFTVGDRIEIPSTITVSGISNDAVILDAVILRIKIISSTVVLYLSNDSTIHLLNARKYVAPAPIPVNPPTERRPVGRPRKEVSTNTFFTDLEARVLAANPDEIRLEATLLKSVRKLTLEQFLIKFFKEYNNERNTIFVESRATHTEMGKLISAGRGTKPIQSQNYNLSQVPHAVLLAVVPQKNGKVFELLGGKTDLPVNSLPDIYFPITGVNIKLGNRSGILSNAPSATLFEMNRQNGLAFCNYPNSGMAVVSTTNNNTVNPGVMFQLNTFTETVGTTPSSFLCLPGQGCPLLLRFGKDIPLDDASLSAGVACNTNITFNLQVNSPYLTGNSTAELVVIFLYDGVFTISASAGSSFNVGLLSREDVIASDKNRIDFGELQGAPGSGGMLGGVMVGGSFLSKLKKMGRSSWNVIKNPKVQNYLRKGLNLAADLDIPGASAVNTAINTLEGNGMYRKGGMLGGNVLSATEIRRRLYQ